MGTECHSPPLRLQHGGHAARRQVDRGAGLRVARAGFAQAGCAEVHVRPEGTARACAAVPL